MSTSSVGRLICRSALSTSIKRSLATSNVIHQEAATQQVDPNVSTEKTPLYLDVQATTPMDPRVADAMLPYMLNDFGNPHSRTHSYGWVTEKAVEKAREQVASIIGADPREVVFTSGATESNNVAIKGVAHFYKHTGKNHVITAQTEHKCVLDSCRYLENEGFKVTYLPVQNNGLISLEELDKAIGSETSQSKEIGELCRKKKVHFHTDAAQAVGKIPLNVDENKIDLMSISGHKIYGPKGIGALYVRRRPRVRIEAQMSGGGQERGMRSGTLPAPLAVGIGEACSIAQREMAFDHAHISRLANRLIDGINAKLEHVVRNGDPTHWYPGCVNLSFAYVEGESLLMALKDIALSSGSACTSASLEPSYVLRAIGADEDLAHSSIRFGIGRFTTEEEIDYTVAKSIKEAHRLREMSPLWEMVQEGIDLKSIQCEFLMQASLAVVRRSVLIRHLRFASSDLSETSERSKAPVPKQVNKDKAVYDKVTHTGQAWDQADYRLNRFEFSEKQVNPNVAAHLVAQQPPVASEEHVVWCDGGHPATGHPKIFINLDKPGTHACGYCGKRFYNVHSTKPDQMDIAHIQV
ncbi:Cysteine desulfurase, mitochondrial [Aphelenchoides bicaudatus]|nr:Cysteine desulfurase, mitochondrial [Aphelenchoides bicaudatus]